MMSVIGPVSAAPGTTVCITVNGAVGNLQAAVNHGDDALPFTHVKGPGGSSQICVSLPAGMRGGLRIELADDSGNGLVTHAIIVWP